MEKNKAELKYVSIVFIKIDLSELPKNKLPRFRKYITSSLKEMVETLEGFLLPLGDRYLIVYGYPKTHENNPERALNTALHFKKQIMGRIEGIYPKIGVASGEVLISHREFGPPEIIGNPANTGARLADMAEGGEILCDSNTYSFVKFKFEFMEKGEVKLKGMKKKVSVFSLIDRRKGILRKRSFGSEGFPFVDREKELFLLRKFVEDVFIEEIGKVVFLLGDAGIGKSRLVEEVYSQALGYSLENMKQFQWYEGKCNRGIDTVAFQPFIEIIRGFIGEWIDGDPEKIRGAITRYMDDTEDTDMIMHILGFGKRRVGISEASEKGKIFNALLQFIYGISLMHPTVFVIDDLYSADTSTLEFLEYMSGRLNRFPFLMIILSRIDKNLPFWRVKENMKSLLGSALVEIYLKKLDEEDALKLIDIMKGKENIPENVIKRAVELSHGNPLYLEEFIRYYIERQSGRETDIPPTIRGLIDSRIDSLDPGTKEVLEEASVIGYRVDREILGMITDHFDDLNAHIRKLVNASILSDVSEGKTENLYFYHPLYREVAYKRMLSRHKKRLHKKIAQTIEEHFSSRIHEFYEELARHYKNADEKNKAVKYSILAGEKLEKNYASQEAIKFYRDALEICEDRSKTYELLLRIAHLERLSGNGNKALSYLEECERICESTEERIKVYTSAGTTYESMSRYDEALTYYKKALSTGKEIDFRLKIPAYLGIAWVYYIRGKYDEVENAIMKIKGFLETVKNPDEIDNQHLARAYNILASTYNSTGRHEFAFQLYTGALKIYRSLGDEAGISTIHNNLSGIFSGIGDYLTAIEYLENAYEIDEKMGRLLGCAIALYNIGENYLELYHLDMAEEFFNRYLEMNKKIHNILGNGYGNWGMGRVYLERGEFKKAEEYINKSIEILDDLKAETVKLYTVSSLYDLLLRSERFKELEKLLYKYEENFEKTKNPDLKAWYHLIRGLLYLNKEKYHLAEKELIKSSHLAQDSGEKMFVLRIFSALHRLYSELGEDLQSEFYFKRGKGIVRGIEVFLEDKPDVKKLFIQNPVVSYFING